MGGPPASGVMRSALVRRALGVHVTYRSSGGGLIVGGLAYAALFALLPTLVLVIAGIFLLVDDPTFRQDAIDLLSDAFPAFSGFTDTAVQGARELATVGGLIALVGILWGASGLYLNLTRAMERFFPGPRVSGALTRVARVLLVLLVIGAVLVGVIVAGAVTVVARTLSLDVDLVLTVGTALAAFVVATAIVYGIYRLIPANPPAASSARLPALLVGLAVAGMTLLYGLVAPWLVTGFEVYGVAASIFVALIWLRVVFLAIAYGAALARYRDLVAAATVLGEPEGFATEYVLAEETRRAEQEAEGRRALERRADEASAGPDAPESGGSSAGDA